ncbi:MAG: hypothetical protein KatS3mg050_2446 [Litorilinea sp.]|nr:MAG: hypothetical protein KatS3mg050_2446 [Litorilinea sp.]
MAQQPRTKPAPPATPESPPGKQNGQPTGPLAPLPAPTAVAPAEPSRRRHGRPPAILAILLVLLLATAVWWIGAGRPAPTQLLPWPWQEPAGPLVASGTLEADEILVGSEIAGRIVSLVQEGQPVQADQILAQLDDSLIQIQIRQANVAARQQLEVQLERYRLHSPIDGVVMRVPMHVGEVVSPGQTVAAVADLSSLKLTAYVLERDLGQVRVGQPVAVTVDPFPDRTFPGVVTGINQRAEFTPRNVQTRSDRLNLVFGVRIRVENPEGLLKPGMPADATFLEP